MLIQSFGYNATTRATGRLVSLGQQFGGGTIGYIQGNYPNQKGIIVSNENVSGSYAWSSLTFASSTNPNLFKGATNTANILANDPNAFPAKYCNDYTGSGFTDWVLPSQNDLVAIFPNNSLLATPFNAKPSAGTTLYWTSYSSDLGSAWAFDFNPSSPYVGNVASVFRCCGPSSPGPGLPFRPVRYFDLTPPA